MQTHRNFVVCSHTFILFWLSKTAVTVKIFWLSFCVPFLRWSLQFLVRVFPFRSLILCNFYVCIYLSSCWCLVLCGFETHHQCGSLGRSGRPSCRGECRAACPGSRVHWGPDLHRPQYHYEPHINCTLTYLFVRALPVILSNPGQLAPT